MASQSLRILLIADDPEVIRRIGQGLQRQDSGLILIEGADSLATARRRLGAGAYDLALVDLAVGQGDGLHLLSDLKEIAPELPVVALSANGAGPDAAACVALGAQDRLAPEAMDSAGLVDRLHSATARARAGSTSRRRSQRIAASLGAAGDLAWHYEQGEPDVWLAAADPAAWQLPAPECHESLDGLRARIHPDDREIVLRRIEELIGSDEPWAVEARVRVGGGAYRWSSLRGQAQRDARGNLERAAGVVADTQRQHRRVRELEQGRRYLRAVFDSDRVPHAVLDSSGVISECNQAWNALDDTACHAGKAFPPGRRFIDQPDAPGAFGDLDNGELVKGVRQVLGGVIEQFACEYGDGDRRWRMVVSPLLNPGIAGAVVRHEEVTGAARAGAELQDRLADLERDLGALAGVLFRLAPDFTVLAAGEAAKALGRAPVLGRDVLKVLPRAHAEAVGDALAALAAGARSAVRDGRMKGGPAIRWLVSSRQDGDGAGAGYLVQGVEVSDLLAALPDEPAAGEEESEAMTTLRAALASTEQQREALRKELAEARESLVGVNEQVQALEGKLAEGQQRIDELHGELQRAEAQREELQAAIEQLRRESEQARRLGSEVEQENDRLVQALEGERQQHSETLAALAAARQVPTAIRAELNRARHGLRADLDGLVDRFLGPLLAEPDSQPSPAAKADQDKSETG